MKTAEVQAENLNKLTTTKQGKNKRKNHYNNQFKEQHFSSLSMSSFDLNAGSVVFEFRPEIQL
jgi:hypothetical protein